MTSTPEAAPSGPRLKTVQELEKLVQSYIRDSESVEILPVLDEALGCYENYKKELKLSEIDYEKAFLYYRTAYKTLTDKIPSLPTWDQFSSSTNAKNRDTVSFYESMCFNIKNDGNIDAVIKYIRDNSTPPPPPNPFDFKHNGTINARQLKVLLEKYGDKILLVDFRSRDEFKKNHIRSTNVICIEPISIRDNYRDIDIEDFSLVTSPDQERDLFFKRDLYELIIIYDNSSSAASTEKMARFYRILTMRAFEKRLKRSPVILEGGISAWINLYGLANFGHNHGNLTMPERLLTRRPSQNNRNNVAIARTFHDYISNPSKTDFSINGHQQSPRPTLAQMPPQQVIPIKRRNSLLPSFPSLGSTKPQTTSTTPPPPPVPPHSPSHVLNTNLLNAQSRSNTPQPAAVTHSYNTGSPSGSTELSKLHCTTGICNLGNSCYMNCIIQCLLGTVPLTRFFYDGTYSSQVNINSRLGSKGIMARYFAQLVSSIFTNADSVIEPRNFKSVVGSINAMFNNNDQQDCSEFLNFVLDALHEDLNEAGNKPRHPPPTEEEEKLRESMPIRLAATVEWERYLSSDFSAIVHFFQGQYASQLKCMECGTTSTTYQSFSVLSLPIPEQYANVRYDKIPLDKCFEEFTKLEVLDGDNRWHCSKCKELRKSTKKITITRLPQHLIVHLKRFRSGSSYQKVTTFIEYPFELNLTKYWPPVSSPAEAAELSKHKLRGQTPPFNYNLYGVANHSGTLGSGHYTAFVWKGIQKKWCHFDDTKVSKNVSKSAVVNANAYVLFYARC